MIFDIDRHGSRPALLDAGSDRWLSHAELAGAVSAGADAIRCAFGARPLILLLADSTVATVVTTLAALEAGAVIALFPANLSGEHVARLLDIYPADAVFGGGMPDGYAPFDRLPMAGAVRRRSAPIPLHPDLAVLLPTSGSTGSPKLVRLTRAAVEANAASIATALSITADQRAGLSLPLSYSYGLSVLNSHLVAGASVLLSRDGVLSRTWWDRLSEHAVTSMPGVPTVYEMLARLDCGTLFPPTLNTLTQAGGALSPRLAARFHDLMAARGGRLFIMYGQTEATARMSILDAADLPERLGPEHLGSVGRAIPGGAFSILPADQDGGSGEIVYRGPNVMMGYAERVEDLALGDQLGGILATGDLGRLDADGYLTITGRLKRIVKVAGLRVSLDEIEAIARQVCPAAAVEAGGGLVMFAQTDPAGVAEVRRLLQSSALVPPTLVKVRAIGELPMRGNGKIDLAALEELV